MYSVLYNWSEFDNEALVHIIHLSYIFMLKKPQDNCNIDFLNCKIIRVEEKISIKGQKINKMFPRQCTSHFNPPPT